MVRMNIFENPFDNFIKSAYPDVTHFGGETIPEQEDYVQFSNGEILQWSNDQAMHW